MGRTGIEKLFAHLSVVYGAAWERSLGTAPIDEVKELWQDELALYLASSRRIEWVLERLPERPPNVREFVNLCRQSPAPTVPLLPEPQADKARVAAEFKKLNALKSQPIASDGLAWARVILTKHQSGQRVSSAALRSAVSVLGNPLSQLIGEQS